LVNRRKKEWKGSPKMKYYSVGKSQKKRMEGFSKNEILFCRYFQKKEWKGSPKMKYYSVGIFKKESNYKFQKNKNLSP